MSNYWDHIEAAFEEVDIYESPEVFQQGAAKYPAWKIDLLAVHWTMSEIVNGGLEQYFQNHTAVLAPEAVVGFEHLGRQDLAEALKKAMALLGSDYPRDRDARTEKLQNLTGRQAAESEGFSLIPKWVAEKVGRASEKSPFSDLDELFASSSEAVELAMDAYAHSKSS